MFIHGIDMDREFDLILQSSIPYILFPPRDMYGEFIDKLIGDLATLHQYKRGNDDVMFTNQCKAVSNLLDDTSFHPELMGKIQEYNHNQTTINNAFKKLAEKQVELENRLVKLENAKTEMEEAAIAKTAKAETAKAEMEEAAIAKTAKAETAKAETAKAETAKTAKAETEITQQKKDFSIFSRSMRKGSRMYRVFQAIFDADKPITLTDIENTTGIPRANVVESISIAKAPSKSQSYGRIVSHISESVDSTGQKLYEWVDSNIEKIQN